MSYFFPYQTQASKYDVRQSNNYVTFSRFSRALVLLDDRFELIFVFAFAKKNLNFPSPKLTHVSSGRNASHAVLSFSNNFQG